MLKDRFNVGDSGVPKVPYTRIFVQNWGFDGHFCEKLGKLHIIWFVGCWGFVRWNFSWYSHFNTPWGALLSMTVSLLSLMLIFYHLILILLLKYRKWAFLKAFRGSGNKKVSSCVVSRRFAAGVMLLQPRHQVCALLWVQNCVTPIIVYSQLSLYRGGLWKPQKMNKKRDSGILFPGRNPRHTILLYCLWHSGKYTQ